MALSLPAHADEGMWTLYNLPTQVYDQMCGYGFQLPYGSLYQGDQAVKNAVVNFSGYCSGVVVSPDGLVFTNHHCGFESIRSHSTVEHDYMLNGFYAKTYSEELPNDNMFVAFMVKQEDVTPVLEKAGFSKLGHEGKAAAVDSLENIMTQQAKAQDSSLYVTIDAFYEGNQWIATTYQQFDDLRLVFTIPKSMGKFGGETDNWMWPRHTCDFSMFRVYAGADNEPADYSADNVPMTPKQFLKVSLKGVEEGDFAMIMGYPGRTQRYQTASQLEEMLAINDIRIAARGVRQDVLWKEMRADDKVGLQYANKYASSSNGWKKWIGMKEAFGKLDVIGREKEKEAELGAWIADRKKREKKYGDPMAGIAAVTEGRSASYRAYTLLSETIGRIELFSLVKAKDASVYKDYNSEVDRKVAHAMVSHYLENAAPEGRLEINDEMIDRMFDGSAFTSAERLEAARAAGVNLENDPAVVLRNAYIDRITPLLDNYRKLSGDLEAPSKAYAAALLEWQKDSPSYPDANMTCRLTYGTVKGYEPKDGVIYKYYTTLKGVMEKEDPGNYEFRVPAKLKELYNARDYGQYANGKGEIVTCFLTNLDITGGNSGSPVMDADGNLIGLAFDGNWEAMSGDVIFEPELQRCICVDIRYVLFMMDKFGGAGWLLDEMNIVK